MYLSTSNNSKSITFSTRVTEWLYYAGLIVFFAVSLPCYAQIQKARDTYPNGQAKYKGKYIKCVTREDKYPYLLNYENRKFGPWVYYYPSGVISEIRHYTTKVKSCKEQIHKEGEWKYFNEDGVLYRSEVYSLDTLVFSAVDIYEQQLPVGKITLTNHTRDTILFGKKGDVKNLILNPSFEQYFYKPILIINSGKNQIEQLVPHWHSPDRATPDYYNPFRKVRGIPEHLTTSLGREDNNGYVGLMLCRGEEREKENPLIDNNEGVHRYFFDYKESIQSKLLQKLEKDAVYCFKARILLSRNSGYSIDRFEVLFSEDPIRLDYPQSIKDSILSFNHLPNDPQHWFSLCKGFTASGREAFITLGRINEYDDLTVRARVPAVPSELAINRSAYYLVDDLQLFQVDSLLACECDPMNTESLVLDQQHGLDEFMLDELKPGKRFVLGTVRFDFDNAGIRAAFIPELKRLSDYLSMNPACGVTIYGHTDDAGTPFYNQRLSAERATAVKDWLVHNGIEERRIACEGLGDRFPVVENATGGNRQINRRVEVEIVCDNVR